MSVITALCHHLDRGSLIRMHRALIVLRDLSQGMIGKWRIRQQDPRPWLNAYEQLCAQVTEVEEKLKPHLPVIVDIADMPDFNPAAGLHGTKAVSAGEVTWTLRNKATCHLHEAMLCVSPNRRIWRCPACNVGCYVKEH